MKFQNFTVLDFINNDVFLKHQLSPSKESTIFWQNWLENNSQKSVEWHQAQELVKAVRLGLSEYARTYLSEDAEAQLLSRIRSTTNAIPQSNRAFSVFKNTWVVGSIAASILFVLGIVLWNLKQNPSAIYQQQIALEKDIIENVNYTSKPQVIHLPDGSAVILSPKSKLSYSINFNKDNRKVFLLGEATFEVTKNPSKPFLVYANELITKVLGTKFIVKSYEKDKEVLVKVIRGQVSVYRNSEVQKQALEGVLLLPNQQVVFERNTENFTKTIIENPLVVEDKNAEFVSFEFEETPIKVVFERIEKAYGIDIVYSEELLKDCQLTASLSEESLFQKLDIITQSIGATYETLEGQIVISSKGCK